jgi:dTDP-4-amino-4,6-dideoxygalactose transaminase
MTTGEGGMILTDRDDVLTHTESFANHGRPPEGGYEHVRLGHNFRMTNIAAAIGLEQLEKLPDFLAERRQNAQRFHEGIDEDIVELPSVPSDRTHAYHQYTVRTDARDELLEHLHNHDVGAEIYYPKCIHQQPAYDGQIYDYECPVAERAANKVVSLPVHPNLSDNDIETIIDAVNSFYQKL